MAEYESRIKLKRDTSANWTEKDPVLLDGEIVIVKTANGSTRKKVGDGTKKYSQLPFDDEEILSAISSKSDHSTSVSATLTYSGWSNGSQTLSISNLKSTHNGTIGLSPSATPEQVAAACTAKLRATAQNNGSITITAGGAVPACDIPVEIVMVD